MSRSRRLSEKWFNRLLWVIAILFAFFLIGLGGRIIEDLPTLEKPLEYAHYLPDEAKLLQAEIRELSEKQASLSREERLLSAQLEAQETQYENGLATFNNWLATRAVVPREGEDAELIARRDALSEAKEAIGKVSSELSTQKRTMLELNLAEEAAQSKLWRLKNEADRSYSKAIQKQELRVFLYRLLITLPLLLLAMWLFAKRRHGKYWPFSWGFILFALFAFFFELAPYLPSYGGYVRYGVGVLLTLLGGLYAIRGLQRYQAKQRAQEFLPDEKRREALPYDLVLKRLDKSACPSCERSVDFKDSTLDFCPHCGMELFNHCVECDARKNAFLHYCYACGAKDLSVSSTE